MLNSLSSKVKWAVVAAVALVLVVAGASTAYALNYQDKALPGVTVAGSQLEGKTRDQVEADINSRAADAVIDIRLNGVSVPTTLAEAGVTVDAKATADRVFERNSSILSRFAAVFSSQAVAPVVTTDADAVKAFARKVNEAAGSPVTNAEVSASEDGVFSATQAAAGSGVSDATVEKVLTGAAAALASTTIDVDAKEVAPAVTTEAARAVADKANALVALDATVTDGIDSFSASAPTKASWVTIEAGEDGALADPVFDPMKITEWITQTALSTNVEAVNGVNNVNSEGQVLTVAKEGTSGWTVNNAEQVAKDAVAALTSGQPYSGSFDYDEVKPSYEERRVAEGAENLVYQAAEGEKWIDLDLSSNTVTAYEGGKAVGGPYYMVPGAPETPTVTGTFHVYLKYKTQTMRGENVDGTKYETEDVPWVSYFTGSYAFHGAPWRSSFGWSGRGGSHGCVNMPVAAAKFIYDWSQIGTVVVSHY